MMVNNAGKTKFIIIQDMNETFYMDEPLESSSYNIVADCLIVNSMRSMIQIY